MSLKVTPRISANNYVKLKVTPRVIRLGDQVTSIVGGVANSVDSFDTREIDTSVMIPSGNTLVMGGLIQDNVHEQNTKVPSWATSRSWATSSAATSRSRTKSNLIVFITPTIVEDEDFQPTKSTFLKTPVPVKDTVEEATGRPGTAANPRTGARRRRPSPTFDDSLAQPGTRPQPRPRPVTEANRNCGRALTPIRIL